MARPMARPCTTGEAASFPATASVASPGLGIVEFLRGKNIMITGATGFLAKGMGIPVYKVRSTCRNKSQADTTPMNGQ